jgi:hypothetical protein
VQLRLGFRAVALRDLVPADALDLSEGIELVVANLPDLLDHELHRLGVGLAVLGGLVLQRGRQLARLDAPREIDLLRRIEQRHLADLLEVHAHRVVGRRAQQIDLDADLRGGIGVVAGDLDHLDALGGEVFLHLCQELLDLLLREVVDGDGFEEVFGGDEAALPAFDDQLLFDLVEAERLGFAGGNAHGRRSWGVSITTAPVYGSNLTVTAPSIDAARRRSRRAFGRARHRQHRSWGSSAGACRGPRRSAL